MIHLQQTTEEQTLTIPRPQAVPASGAWALHLRNGVTRKEQTFDVEPQVDGMVIRAAITFESKPDKGQYGYELRRGDVVVSRGIAQVEQTSMRPQRVQYSETITTIQYNG